MGQRQTLQTLLESLLGSRNVYFQPPANTQIKYPAIVYSRNWRATEFAGNRPYTDKKRYQITVIDRNPDSEVPDKIAALPLCKFASHFSKDGLNHDIFNLYF